MLPPLLDARGVPFAPASAAGEGPRRIVSLVPSWTETLAALGLGARVVGATRFCVHPAAWHHGPDARPRVGGTKTVDVEAVRALRPDLVVANREENVREQVEAVEAFAPVFLTDAATVEEALSELRALGRLTGTGGAAEALAAGIEAAFAAAERPAQPRRAAYFIWKDPWMVAGGGTFVHDMLARTGFANVFGDRPRYPAVTADEVAAARPDVLLFSSEPFAFREKHVGALRKACPAAAVCFVDGEAFSWYGVRMARAVGEARAVHAALEAARDGR